jgi:hypothetical protein
MHLSIQVNLLPLKLQIFHFWRFRRATRISLYIAELEAVTQLIKIRGTHYNSFFIQKALACHT